MSASLLEGDAKDMTHKNLYITSSQNVTTRKYKYLWINFYFREEYLIEV